MPSERVPMRKIRDVLRLRLALGLPQRAVGCSLGLSQAAVSEYLGRARRAGVGWPLPDGLGDEQLEALLFPPPSQLPVEQRPVPDWAWVHRELRRPNVTLALLWEEHRSAAPDGFGYSWFGSAIEFWVLPHSPCCRFEFMRPVGPAPEGDQIRHGHTWIA